MRSTLRWPASRRAGRSMLQGLRERLGRSPAAGGPDALDRQLMIGLANRGLELHTALMRHVAPVQPVDAEDARHAPVEVMTSDDARCTIFAFGGMAHGFAMPVREFHGVLSGTPSNLVFLKDFHQAWYFKGLLGATTTLSGTAAFLQDRFAQMARPWIFTGSSSGGFAAMHFGRVMAADRVVAFASKTRVTPEVWQRRRPPTAPDAEIDFSDPATDLATTFAARPRGCPVHIHFGETNAGDKAHAERLARFPEVTLHAHDTFMHSVARYLRERDELIEAIFGDTVTAIAGAA